MERGEEDLVLCCFGQVLAPLLLVLGQIQGVGWDEVVVGPEDVAEEPGEPGRVSFKAFGLLQRLEGVMIDSVSADSLIDSL